MRYIRNINKQNKEIEKLKKIIKCLCIDNPINKEIYEAIPKDCENILKNIARENGGKIDLNEEENKYIFRKTKNMFEGLTDNKTKETELKPEEKNIETKEEEKEEIKEEAKEEIKEEIKEEVKNEVKEETKEEINKNKENKSEENNLS